MLIGSVCIASNTRATVNTLQKWLQFGPSKPDRYCGCGGEPTWRPLHWFSRAFDLVLSV